jgi:hypothetical protein
VTNVVLPRPTYATYKEAVLAAGPRYYWNWDDGSFGLTDMISSNLGAAAGGQLHGSKTYAAGRTDGTSSAGGLSLGQTATFPGTAYDQWGTWSPGSAMDDGVYTNWAMDFWIKVDPAMLGFNGHGYVAELSDTGVFIIDYYTNLASFTWGDTVAIKAMSMGVWHHVVFGKRGTTLTCIVDGDMAGKATCTVPDSRVFSAVNTGFLRLGTWAGYSALFKGQLDEFAVYNLTGFDSVAYNAKLAALANHYSATLPPPPGTMVFLR